MSTGNIGIEDANTEGAEDDEVEFIPDEAKEGLDSPSASRGDGTVFFTGGRGFLR